MRLRARASGYRVTADGGARAWWRADGRQLRALNADWTQVLVADIRAGSTFVTDVPRQVGRLPKGIVALDVTPDLTRLLALVDDGISDRRSVTVVQHFDEEMKRFVPRK